MSIYYPHMIYYRTSRPSRSMFPSSPKTLSNDPKRSRSSAWVRLAFPPPMDVLRHHLSACHSSRFPFYAWVRLAFLSMHGFVSHQIAPAREVPRIPSGLFSHFWCGGGGGGAGSLFHQLDLCSTSWIFVPPAGTLFHEPRPSIHSPFHFLVVVGKAPGVHPLLP